MLMWVVNIEIAPVWHCTPVAKCCKFCGFTGFSTGPPTSTFLPQLAQSKGLDSKKQHPGTAPALLRVFNTQLCPPSALSAWLDHYSPLFRQNPPGCCFCLPCGVFHQIVPLTPNIPIVFQRGVVQKDIQAVEEEVILTRLLDLDSLNFILTAMVSPTRSSIFWNWPCCKCQIVHEGPDWDLLRTQLSI